MRSLVFWLYVALIAGPVAVVGALVVVGLFWYGLRACLEDPWEALLRQLTREGQELLAREREEWQGWGG